MRRRNLNFSGVFQIWTYDVGHAQLLLRSTKSIERDTQIDILFKGVAAIYLPTLFRDFEIRRSSLDQLTPAVQLGSRSRDERAAFRIVGQNVDGYVVALVVFADESDLDHNTPSPLLSGYYKG